MIADDWDTAIRTVATTPKAAGAKRLSGKHLRPTPSGSRPGGCSYSRREWTVANYASTAELVRSA